MNTLKLFADTFKSTEPMPVLFVGHGSPMNAIEQNEFTNTWTSIGNSLPKPAAILCISAHWETRGTLVTAMPEPQTIHDFGGFPQELFDVQYPAPGSPGLAVETQRLMSETAIGLDEKWGLDHGTWSVLRQFYPKAEIPVVQLSLDYYQNAQFHYDLAKQLLPLRNMGVLIIGSGNMVHNLRMIEWNQPQTGSDWAMEANRKFKNLIENNDYQQLINYRKLGREVELAIPTPEHFLPLLYALALKTEKDGITFFNDKTVMGSLSMTSVKIG